MSVISQKHTSFSVTHPHGLQDKVLTLQQDLQNPLPHLAKQATSSPGSGLLTILQYVLHLRPFTFPQMVSGLWFFIFVFCCFCICILFMLFILCGLSSLFLLLCLENVPSFSKASQISPAWDAFSIISTQRGLLPALCFHSTVFFPRTGSTSRTPCFNNLFLFLKSIKV